jgi:dTDP-4-dehydrorhamnose reductase
VRILLTGPRGQIGWELERALLPLGEACALARDRLDLADPDAIAQRCGEIRPRVIVNAAAYTAVDKAETEKELAFQINATAPGVLAAQAKRIGALLVHFSTDYVFDGTLERPYLEDDAAVPVNAYGASKLAGEQAIEASGGDFLILRTSWVYAGRGTNFLRTILRLAREREVLSVVSDQVGAPTSARLIAEATAQAIPATLRQGIRGTFHLSCRGSTSWHGFASRIVEQARALGFGGLRAASIVPISSSEYRTAAARPKNSRLECGKLEAAFGMRLPGWEPCADLVLRGIVEGGKLR